MMRSSQNLCTAGSERDGEKLLARGGLRLKQQSQATREQQLAREQAWQAEANQAWSKSAAYLARTSNRKFALSRAPRATGTPSVLRLVDCSQVFSARRRLAGHRSDVREKIERHPGPPAPVRYGCQDPVTLRCKQQPVAMNQPASVLGHRR